MDGRRQRRLQPGPADREQRDQPSGLRRRPIVRSPLVPASPAQRAKVAALACVVCDRAPADPAHVVPRRLGGCDGADCVIPLCRTHHRVYDHGQLALGVHLGGAWRLELAHALTHVSPDELRRALRGLGWYERRPPAG